MRARVEIVDVLGWNKSWGIFDVYQRLLVSSIRGIFGRFFLFRLPEWFWIIYKLGLSGSFTVPIIVNFFSTVAACNMIQVSPGSIILLFTITLVVPSFPLLHKHNLVSDPIGLIISIRVIIRLIIYRETLYCGHLPWAFRLVQHIIIFNSLI